MKTTGLTHRPQSRSWRYLQRTFALLSAEGWGEGFYFLHSCIVPLRRARGGGGAGARGPRGQPRRCGVAAAGGVSVSAEVVDDEVEARLIAPTRAETSSSSPSDSSSWNGGHAPPTISTTSSSILSSLILYVRSSIMPPTSTRMGLGKGAQ